jgi:alpha-methylacyl-CoA racemase
MPSQPEPDTPAALRPLDGVRILSLALNLPGPAALMRCQNMGAVCSKLEPPAGDPMMHYSPPAYAALHQGVHLGVADLKTAAGQDTLQQALASCDVLLTSFRPSALEKLGLAWSSLQQRYPALSQVAIVGAPGADAETPGHDLTYMAQNDLLSGLELPPSLYADMGGSLMASEAVLKAVVHQRRHGRGAFLEVALSEAASYLALPRAWGLTQPGAAVGGGHAGYRVYACQDGRVALAALEPHFADRLCAAAGVAGDGPALMFSPSTHQQMAAFLRTQTRAQLKTLARDKDIPLHTLSSLPVPD